MVVVGGYDAVSAAAEVVAEAEMSFKVVEVGGDEVGDEGMAVFHSAQQKGDWWSDKCLVVWFEGSCCTARLSCTYTDSDVAKVDTVGTNSVFKAFFIHHTDT